MGRKLDIKGKQIDLSRRGKVVISNNTLANGLVQNQKRTLSVLSMEFAPIRVTDIEIDAGGNVVISNSKFKNRLKELMAATPASVAADTNYGCGNNLYKCSGK